MQKNKKLSKKEEKAYFEQFSEMLRLKKSRDTCLVLHQYGDIEKKILLCIEKMEKINGEIEYYERKNALPKRLEFEKEIVSGAVTTSPKFIAEKNQSLRVDFEMELARKLKPNEYIGRFSVNRRIIFYSKDNKSTKQFDLPLRGIFIEQKNPIEVRHIDNIRQKRTNALYENMVLVATFKRFKLYEAVKK